MKVSVKDINFSETGFITITLRSYPDRSATMIMGKQLPLEVRTIMLFDGQGAYVEGGNLTHLIDAADLLGVNEIPLKNILESLANASFALRDYQVEEIY
ncbi:hypothetical protein My1_024 [Pectobacterium phage My1]|uniref:Uncharacterized protein n=1 Tax=Pectobacterium phage My1 TaxID=1204539 RepID=J9QM55_9CAUD|nr:hypothetical protein My1_024 [Pectobacterium phage My1]AFQ22183.1 hypothetical protein My1_024 [Pectobacterium phage My1]